ncbi:MAG: AAA family ATPase [Sandaracinaceae bacterium]|nr:AAA family ATPase [Sandaracinaceae bacterium]
MPWISGLHARNLRHLARLRLELKSGHDRPRHLVILGSSGSGKTTLLDAITDEIEAAIDGRPHPAEGIDELERDGEKRLKIAHVGRPLRVSFCEGDVASSFAESESLFAYCASPRFVKLDEAREAVMPSTAPARPRAHASADLTTLLLVHDTELRLARNTRDAASAGQHEVWLQRTQDGLRMLLDQPALRLSHDRGGFHLDLPDGRRWELAHLSHGLGSMVSIWGEAHVRTSNARARRGLASFEPSGALLIDAPESDLDPRLQANLLPALTRFFPRLQLVVATHSPLLAASLEHALVLDLDRNQTRTSEDVRRAGADELLAQMIGARLEAKASSLPPPAFVGAPPPAPSLAPEPPSFTPPKPPSAVPPAPGTPAVETAIPVARAISAPPPSRLPPRPKSIPAPPPIPSSPPPIKSSPPPLARERERKTVEGPGPWSDD